MGRRFLGLATLTAVALALWGCGDDEATGDGDGSGATGGSSASGGSGGTGTGGSGGSGGSSASGGSGGSGGDAGSGGTGGDSGAAGMAGAGTGGSAGAGCELDVATSYDAGSFAANTAAETAILAQFNAFTQIMKDAEASASVVPTVSELTALYDAGTPNLRSLTTTYYAGKIDELIADFAAAAGNTWTPAEPATGSGGIYGGVIFNERGTDLRQLIEKGMYGATFYNYALTLMGTTIDLATVDRLLAIYGAHFSFPDDTQDSTYPNALLAVYADRRDNGTDESPAYYREIRDAFLRAQAAVKAGTTCDTERDAALLDIRKALEEVNFATVIFYANSAMLRLAADPLTDADMSSALHSLGEATAFVHGFKTLPTDKRTVTDAQIDELLALLNAPASGPIDTYKFATDPASEIPKLQQVVTKVQQVYGFSSADVTKFKTNY